MKISSKFIMPKNYLSWTQLDMWLRSEARYRREYFDSTHKLDTKYLRFGGAFATMLEDMEVIFARTNNRQLAIEELAREYPMTENMKAVLMDIEIEGISEYEIKTKVMGIVPCFSKVDKYDPINNVLREYKTGKIPWTQAKVQKHDQLVFYATMLKWEGKPVPEYCDLDWIETKETEQVVEDFWREQPKILDVTGRILSFRREFDEREIERMEQLIVQVATDISAAYQEHISDF